MLDIAIHKNLLIKIIKDIYTDKEIAHDLGFKGGTAALFFYNLPRFSVDLDFDLLDENKKEFVFERIKTILEKYGTVKAQDKRYSLFFMLAYKEKVEGAQNIKIEINKRQFGSQYEIKQLLGISMPVMVKDDMAAHKLVAMYERIGKTNRDIFDVWFFLNNDWPINKKIVESRTDMTYQKFLQMCIPMLEKMSDQNILSGVGELLTPKQKAWVKSNLRQEVVFLLNLALSNEK